MTLWDGMTKGEKVFSVVFVALLTLGGGLFGWVFGGLTREQPPVGPTVTIRSSPVPVSSPTMSVS